MKRKNAIPYETVGRIMEFYGAERVSKDAKAALANYLEEHICSLAKEAQKYAAHAKRVTVRKEDVILASRHMKN